jgi:hypothetical protein
VNEGKTPKSTAARSKRSKAAADDEDEEIEEITPPKKSSGILGALAKGFKRKQADRSPEDAVVSSSRSKMVCVLLPVRPRPYSAYQQLDVRPLQPSFSSASRDMAPPPPHSLSPSLSSFEGQPSGSGGGRNYEIKRYELLLGASQEDLLIQNELLDEERRRNQDRERRMTERFNRERAMFEARIAELEFELKKREGGGSGSRRG